MRHCDSVNNSTSSPSSHNHANSISGISGGGANGGGSHSTRATYHQSHHHHHHSSNQAANSSSYAPSHQQSTTSGNDGNAGGDNISIGSNNSNNINQQIRSRINSFKMSVFQTPRFYRRKIISEILTLYSIQYLISQFLFVYLCVFRCR